MYEYELAMERLASLRAEAAGARLAALASRAGADTDSGGTPQGGRRPWPTGRRWWWRLARLGQAPLEHRPAA